MVQRGVRDMEYTFSRAHYRVDIESLAWDAIYDLIQKEDVYQTYSLFRLILYRKVYENLQNIVTYLLLIFLTHRTVVLILLTRFALQTLTCLPLPMTKSFSLNGLFATHLLRRTLLNLLESHCPLFTEHIVV